MTGAFETPCFFLLSGAVLLLLLLYLFRKKGKTFYTSALFLWEEKAVECRSTFSLSFQKLPLSFFLEAGAILLLACGGAAFFTFDKEKTPPAVVVLNNSFAMTEKLQEEGKKLLLAHLKKYPRRKVIWYRCGKEPELLSRSGADFPFEKHWNADEGVFASEKALVQLRQEYPHAEIILVTDRPLLCPASKKCTVFSVGTCGNNLAVANGRIKGKRVLLELVSFADCDMEAKLKVNSEVVRTFVMKAGERKILNFLLPELPEKMEFRLEAQGDALATDNSVTLLAPAVKAVSCRLSDQLNASERTLVNAVLKDNPDFLLTQGKAELFIAPFSKENRKGPESKLLFHRGKNPFYPAREPLILKGEKIVEGLNTASLKWAAFPGLSLPGRKVIFSEEGALLTGEKLSSGKSVWHLNISPEYSTLAQYPFWPGFFCNLAEICRMSRPGPLEVNVKSGDTFYCNLPEGREKLIWKSGNLRGELAVSGGRAALQLTRVGVYTLQAGAQKYLLSVNPLITSVSDLRSCRKETFLAGQKELFQGNSRRMWGGLFIAGALVLLVLNFCMECKRNS